MFNQVCIRSNQLTQVREVFSLIGNTSISFTHGVEEPEPGFVLDLTSFYYGEDAPTASFNILVQNASGPDFLNQLGILFAHPSYLRTERGLCVFYNNAALGLRGLLENFLTRQGFTEFVLEGVTCDIMPSENLTWHLLPGTLLMNDTKVSSFTYFYQEYLNHRYQYQDFLLLTPGKLNTLKGVVEEIEKASKAFQENRPHLAALFKDLYALHKQNHHLALLADIRAKEITTLHELFRENAQHKETEYILNFYTQEYEVLPLWYKRMGHIIKAVMGKRTWKSLLPKAEAR